MRHPQPSQAIHPMLARDFATNHNLGKPACEGGGNSTHIACGQIWVVVKTSRRRSGLPFEGLDKDDKPRSYFLLTDKDISRDFMWVAAMPRAEMTRRCPVEAGLCNAGDKSIHRVIVRVMVTVWPSGDCHGVTFRLTSQRSPRRASVDLDYPELRPLETVVNYGWPPTGLPL